MTKPNELSGQVQPNTLRTPGPRVAARTPAPNVANALSGQAPVASGWASTSPAPPTVSVPPRAPASSAPASAPISAAPASGWATPQRAQPARTGRRPFSLWTVIVIGIFVINIARAFLGSLGSQGSDNPTRAPFPTAAVRPTPATNAPFPVDPNLKPGAVEFGTAEGANCELTGTATTFDAAASVWWWAHLGLTLPSTARVTWSVAHDHRIVTQEDGPGDTPSGTWDGLCGNVPIPNEGPGTYVLNVKEMHSGVIVSTGQYTIVGRSPLPSVKP